MMANAAKDPFFLAAMEAEIAAAPEQRALIEQSCAKCHTPMASTQALADGAPVRLLGEGGFYDRTTDLHELARDGVSCTMCHQILPDKLGEPESFSGGVCRRPGTPPARPAHPRSVSRTGA